MLMLRKMFDCGPWRRRAVAARHKWLAARCCGIKPSNILNSVSSGLSRTILDTIVDIVAVELPERGIAQPVALKPSQLQPLSRGSSLIFSGGLQKANSRVIRKEEYGYHNEQSEVVDVVVLWCQWCGVKGMGR